MRVDTEGIFKSGTSVASGSYIIPDGVAVEPLKNYNGHKDLKNKCPDDVNKLLSKKGLFNVYDQFVQEIYDTKTTRGLWGKWKDEQFISILDQFKDEFADAGVKVVLCKRKSGNGSYRWLEFIDVDIMSNYVPQYDVSNFSGQIIKTCYTKLNFPNGVAVEQLKDWSGRKKLKEKIPIYVLKMMKSHDLTREYDQMIDHMINAGVSANWKTWKIENLKSVLEVYKPKFHAKGVDIFFCFKEEWISHGQYGGHMEYFRWIEYVDRSEQPNYYPQRCANVKKDCTIL